MALCVERFAHHFAGGEDREVRDLLAHLQEGLLALPLGLRARLFYERLRLLVSVGNDSRAQLLSLFYRGLNLLARLGFDTGKLVKIFLPRALHRRSILVQLVVGVADILLPLLNHAKKRLVS